MGELLAAKQPTVFYYLQLIQPIIRETDTAFYSTPGYVQNFQFNPFGAHLYTETGMSLSSPVYQNKKGESNIMLGFSRQWRRRPQLPVSEMISLEHSVRTTNRLVS